MISISRAALEASYGALGPLPTRRAAVDVLCVRPGPDQRELRDSIQLCPERGAIGDRWERKTWIYLPDGRPDPRVQLAICNSRVHAMIQTLTGDKHHPGDTIMTELDLSAANLPVGAVLQVGESAMIEITDIENDACGKFAARHGAEVFAWIRDPANRFLRLRGCFARVVRAGVVHRGDMIQVR